MAHQQPSLEDVERHLRDFFRTEVGARRAPADLWTRLAPRLEAPPAGGWALGPQRWLAPAFALSLLLLMGVSLAWVLTASPWRGEEAAAPTAPPVREGVRIQAGPSVALPSPQAMEGERAPAPQAPPAPPGALETLQRQVIVTAAMTLEVSSVEEAVARARAIAEGLGGYVQHLSLSGGRERTTATVTLRVPQDQVLIALERLRPLGKVLDQSMGSQDVTEQVIDLEARLRSLRQQEESLLRLLGRAQSVGDILAIERELSRVRGEIERLQGQREALRRRVEMATITLTLLPLPTGSPPSASLEVATGEVGRRVEQVEAMVAARRGVVEGVIYRVEDGRERAEVSLRVFRKDLPDVLNALEGLGKVRRKEVQKGASSGEAVAPAEPDAPIALTLVEPPGWWTRGRVLAIALPGGGVLLLALTLALLRLRRPL
jgi:hypothetical protein